ncbi:DUF461 domain-containing protein [Streptomyces kunmingensis]|uniref:DUF461 domain-containing protein n=1 Tax=Streptomyces kunmingensis TaxID=68225 RepID=A0ABU6C8B6_9ACTN|nr:DUF461 domain-containing protein [Streptomyces kunmingensis]MEB3960095.1 DUF461 domain-containing protein [Streptomyces kunmingensis]
MSSSLRRGALAAAAIAFSIASLAACGAGNNAQTLEVKPDNAATSVGDLKVQNATVITQPDRKSDGPAVVTATIFNNGSTAQTLDSITVEGVGEEAKLTGAKGGSKVTVPAGGSIVLGGKGNATAELPNGRTAVLDGNAQPITFGFSKTGDVKMRAFVVPAESYFEKWGPSEVPSTPNEGAEPSTSASANTDTTPEAGSSAETGTSETGTSMETGTSDTTSPSHSASGDTAGH